MTINRNVALAYPQNKFKTTMRLSQKNYPGVCVKGKTWLKPDDIDAIFSLQLKLKGIYRKG